MCLKSMSSFYIILKQVFIQTHSISSLYTILFNVAVPLLTALYVVLIFHSSTDAAMCMAVCPEGRRQ